MTLFVAVFPDRKKIIDRYPVANVGLQIISAINKQDAWNKLHMEFPFERINIYPKQNDERDWYEFYTPT